MCPRAIYKKKKKKCPFEALSAFSSAGYFFSSGIWVCVALESSLVPSWTTNSVWQRTRTFFFLPALNPRNCPFFLPFGKCQADDEAEALGLGLTALVASQPGSRYACRKKEKGISLNVCKSEYKWPTLIKKQNKTNATTSLFHSLHNNKKNSTKIKITKPDWPLLNLSGDI